MKIRHLFVLALAVLASACGSAGVLIPQVTATMPVVEQLGGPAVSAGSTGFTALGNGMFVKNEIPIPGGWLEIVAYKKIVARLAFGEIGADNRLYQAHEDIVPLAARVYGPGGAFLGAAIHQFQVSSNWPRSQIWVVTPDQVLTPDGFLLSERLGGVGPVPASMRVRKMRIPRPLFSGEHGIQVVLAYNGWDLRARTLPGRTNRLVRNGDVLWIDLLTAEGSLQVEQMLVLSLLDGNGREAFEFPPLRFYLPGWQANWNRTYQVLVTPRGLIRNGY